MQLREKLITILLTDDHALVRRSLRQVLQLDRQMKIVGEARDGREAVKMAHGLRPDVILMDLAMPVLNGIEATKQILAANPAAKIVILSAYSDQAYVTHMTKMGVVGYLAKITAADRLIDAIREVVQGRPYFRLGAS
jgi:DNA-binding NarL/FixJ family response regulator